MQHKNHLGISWGRSTGERVRLAVPQFNRTLSWKAWSELCWFVSGNGSAFEQGMNFGYQANSAQTSWKSLTMLFSGFLQQELTECLEFFLAELP